MYDASDRRSVRRAEKAAALADRNRGEVMAQLAETEPGRRFLWNHLAELHIFETVFHDDPNRMAFLEGQRSVGLKFLGDWIQFAPDQFITAMREANARRTESSTSSDPDANGAARERSGSEEPGWVNQGPSSEDDAGPDPVA